MKTLKKFVAVFGALAMAVSLSVPAFAMKSESTALEAALEAQYPFDFIPADGISNGEYLLGLQAAQNTLERVVPASLREYQKSCLRNGGKRTDFTVFPDTARSHINGSGYSVKTPSSQAGSAMVWALAAESRYSIYYTVFSPLETASGRHFGSEAFWFFLETFPERFAGLNYSVNGVTKGSTLEKFYADYRQLEELAKTVEGGWAFLKFAHYELYDEMFSLYTNLYTDVFYKALEADIMDIISNPDGVRSTLSKTDTEASRRIEYEYVWSCIMSCPQFYGIEETHDILPKGYECLYLGQTSLGRRTPFVDVDDSAWYIDAVTLAYDNGLMTGVGDYAFDPNGSVSLAQAVTMAARTRSTWLEDGHVFPQSEGQSWYQPYVDYSLENGILPQSGFEGSYNRAASRGELAFLIARALPEDALPDVRADVSVPDVAENGAYGAEIYRLYRVGVLTGDDSGAFRPNDGIRRCEAAVILIRAALKDTRG